MYDRNAVRLALVHMLPNVASELGARMEPLLAGAGIVLQEVPWHERIVARAQVSALLRGLARASGEAQVGFHLGSAADAKELGVSAAALFAGATLRDCLALHARHMPDLQAGIGMALVKRGGQACWVHRMRDSDPELSAHLTEGIAVFVVNAVREILGESDTPLTVSFPHRPLGPVARYEDALRCAVAFHAGPDLVIRFDAALLDEHNVRHPLAALLPAGACWTSGEPRRVEGGAMGEAELIAALRGIIGVEALAGPPTLPHAATVLGLSPRTLQRRLAGMDSSWEAIVDTWRSETAQEMLCDPHHRVGTVARRLGYSDPAHFNRAFRRWTGTTPTVYRESRSVQD